MNLYRVRLAFTLTLLLLVPDTGMAQHLKARVEGDRLRVSGPQVHFLLPPAVERLRNGTTVTYVLQLTVRNERLGHIVSRITERFRLSYDLWEEKYAVTRLASPTRSASNLTTNGVESWCLDNLSLPIADLNQNRQFWITLEYETEEPKDTSKTDSSGLTLSSLIDIFSRKPRDEQQVRGFDEIGPVRLDDLRKK